jgi:VIT1/CCC1 family predicted Fe2+/Mn2+ transporter
MKNALRIGLSFGLTSGIITTLGMMVGLNAGTHSRVAVIGGILTIAIADSLSDALGMHLSEETEDKNPSTRDVWIATLSTFFSKLIFASIFIIPILTLDLDTAIMASVALGMFLLGTLSYVVAKSKNSNPFLAIAEHLLIALVVIILTSYVGNWVAENFG